MVLTIDLESESVKDFNMPRDNKYLEDIKKIFPNNIKIDLSNSEKAEIETEIFQRAKKYYESRSDTSYKVSIQHNTSEVFRIQHR
jgi:hypothetical protein